MLPGFMAWQATAKQDGRLPAGPMVII